MHSERLSIPGPGARMKNLAVCFLATALLTTAAAAQLKPTPLTGTWRATAAKRASPNTRPVSAPQPGLLIFTGNYYSRMLITSEEPRTALKDPAKATAAELLATWDPFNAASGAYEISGGNLICHPLVAKNPQVMAPGAEIVYLFKLEGKTLTITEVRNANGPFANPSTITYTRVE
jgi:hypothetical protein